MLKQLLSLTLALLGATAFAVETASVFTDHMVLQRDTPVRIWGRGEAGESISVSFADQIALAKPDADGRWSVELGPFTASAEPRELRVEGNNTLTFTDVLVGDVWLCAGQSNMQWGLKGITGGQELAAAGADPLLRLCKVPLVWARTPLDTIQARWEVATPETLAGFSAIGYLAGRGIRATADVPVGLISMAWGGCRIESMTTLDSLYRFPELAETAERVARETTELLTMDEADIRKDKQRLSTALYNAMVHPFAGFAVKGMIWYQGEDNHVEGLLYGHKLKALADTWRTAFRNPTMPIYVIQLPPFGYGNEDPLLLPQTWAGQHMFTLADPHAELVVATDSGLPDDIHPPDKLALGERLAALIAYRTYGVGSDEALAPAFRRMTRHNDRLVVEFDHANGLTTRDGQPVSDLTVAGADGVFHPATGFVSGSRLFVRSPEVPRPERLRFGWHKTANPNLVNRAGVPAAPFDTGVPVR